jgi:hypothetical protein
MLDIFAACSDGLYLLPSWVRMVSGDDRRILRIPTHLTRRERLFLYRTARGLSRGSIIVEVGSYLGASSCFLAAAAKERKCMVYCVDTWQNDGMSDGPCDTYDAFLRNTGSYRNTVTPIRGRSEETAQDFDRTIDMLFIDGDHSYDGVAGDLRAWLPKLSCQAWIALHDFGWAEGVRRAIGEFVTPIESGPPVIMPNLYAVRIDPARSQGQLAP